MYSLYSSEVWRLNSQYGGGWIKNIHTVTDKTYNLHPTGNCTLNGREYVALPANKKLTAEEKRRYNII
jgi:hypothetical protein